MIDISKAFPLLIAMFFGIKILAFIFAVIATLIHCICEKLFNILRIKPKIQKRGFAADWWCKERWNYEH